MGRTLCRFASHGVATLCLFTSCGSTVASTPITTRLAAARVVARPLQYRDDVVANLLQLQITNGLDQTLALRTIQLRWTGFNSPITRKELTVGVGQRVDLPVPMDVANCAVTGTQVSPAPSTSTATVVLTLADGTTRIADITDPDGTLSGIYAAACERQMILQQAQIGFEELHRATIDGRPITAGVLRIERGRAIDTVSLISVGGTIPFSLEVPHKKGAGPLLVLEKEQAVGEITVYFVEGRCDAHAVAESKQPFRFVAQVDLGDGIIRPLVVEPDATLHSQMLATVAAGCVALGLDGTLQPRI